MRPSQNIVDAVRGLIYAWHRSSEAINSDTKPIINAVALKLQGIRDYGTLTFRPVVGGRWWELVYTTSKKSERVTLNGLGPALLSMKPNGLFYESDLSIIRRRLTRLGINKPIKLINN